MNATQNTRTALPKPGDRQEAPVFRPIHTKRAFEAVCDQIRQQVADGSLQPGHQLPSERELSEQFHISRSGLREALRCLELAGIVQMRTGVNGGVFIKSGGSDGIAQAVRDMVSLGQVPTEDVTEARIELTCVAIRLACERATPAELDALEDDIRHHAELFRLGKGSRDTHAIGEFYRLLARSTHNEVIVMLVDALSEIVRKMLARIDPQPRADIVEVRGKVLACIRAKDPEQACALMTRHFRHLNAYFAEQQKQRQTPALAAKKQATSPRPPRKTTTKNDSALVRQQVKF